MPVYHFSEDPQILAFEPRAPLGRPHEEPRVWAIDAWHQPMYFTPRDCPRACFYPGAQTTPDDRERWFGSVDARMVIAVEAAWLARIRAAALYRYVLPDVQFALHDAIAGHYISRDRVVPLAVEPVGDLLAALAAAEVELRVTPSLIELWRRVVRSTLRYSGTRLRSARGFDPALFA